METKHTPGEFLIDDDTFVYALSKDGVNRFFCGVQAGYDDNGKRTSKKELAATARLFAAAPELLAALQEVLPVLEALLMVGEGPEEGSIGYKARAAIAKATGAA